MRHLVGDEKLLEDGMRYIDLEDSWGLSPLEWAVTCKSFAVVKLLVQKGANMNRKSSNIERPSTGPRRGTPLRLAVSYNNIEITQFLLKSGSDVNFPDQTSMTPLLWAIKQDLSDLVRLLLQSGAEPTLRDNRRKTPLHIAAARASETTVKVLLKAGVPISPRDDKGYTPVYMSSYRGHNEITRLLIAHGARQEDAAKAQAAAIDEKSKRTVLEGRSHSGQSCGPPKDYGSWFFRSTST